MTHGHDVLNMMQDNEYTEEQLLKAMMDHFGADERYCTCHAENMTAMELIGFLTERGRLRVTEHGYVADRSQMCQH